MAINPSISLSFAMATKILRWRIKTITNWHIGALAIPCLFAIAWEPNEYLLWHETLHLMNAKDCYNKFGINKCPDPRCIMRRAPSRINCGDRLTLCSKNVKRIQRFAMDVATAADAGNPSRAH